MNTSWHPRPAPAGGSRRTAAVVPALCALATAMSVVSGTALAAAAAGAPQLDAIEPATPVPWSASAEFSGGSYRWSLSRGALDIGLRFETPSRAGFGVDSHL